MYEAYTRRRATKSGEAKGAVAQLGERLLCKQEAVGSIPSSSTRLGVRSGGPRPGSKQVLSIAYDSVQAWRLG